MRKMVSTNRRTRGISNAFSVSLLGSPPEKSVFANHDSRLRWKVNSIAKQNSMPESGRSSLERSRLSKCQGFLSIAYLL